MIRLKSTKDKYFLGNFKYLIAYDHAAGKKDRYTVLILNVDDPVTIGRELDLKTVRSLIADYELEVRNYYGTDIQMWEGDRESVRAIMKRVIKKRSVS